MRTCVFTFKLQNLYRKLRHPLLTLCKQPQNCAATSSVVIGAVVAGVVADVVAWSEARVSVRRPPPDLCRHRQQCGHIADTRGNTAKLCCTSCDTRVVTTCWFSGTFFVSDGRQKIVNEGSRIPGRLLLNKQVDGCPDIGFMILIDSSWPSLCSV